MIEANVLTCIVLWTIFGFQHSILARPFTKSLVNKIFGSAFEIHFYPFFYFVSQCIIFAAIYDTIRHLKPTLIFFEVPEYLNLFIFWFNRVANIFLIITVFHFNIGKFTGIAQLLEFFSQKYQRGKSKQNDPTLNSSYLYRYIRHPMYLGILLVFISSTSIYTDLFFINLLCIIIYIELGSYFEEKSLVRTFGPQYSEYQKTTKRYIPGVR